MRLTERKREFEKCPDCAQRYGCKQREVAQTATRSRPQLQTKGSKANGSEAVAPGRNGTETGFQRNRALLRAFARNDDYNGFEQHDQVQKERMVFYVV